MTCDFQQCDILTSVDSDEPLQPPFKLRNFKWCLAVVEYLSNKQSLWSYCVYAQADLRLCWSHIVTTLLEMLCHGSLLCNFYSQPFVWIVYIHSLKFQISGKNARIIRAKISGNTKHLSKFCLKLFRIIECSRWYEPKTYILGHLFTIQIFAAVLYMFDTLYAILNKSENATLQYSILCEKALDKK